MRNPIINTKKKSRAFDIFKHSSCCVKVELLTKNHFQPGNLSKSTQISDCCKHYDKQQLSILLHLYIFPN